jgi:penicillin amidase
MKKILGSIALLLLIALIFGYFFINHAKPKYSGALSLAGLQAEVTVKYDEYGIPHIYAENETDAYFALGYVQAQERLFQMEMIRRVASGTLSEILGPDLLPTDKLFRTLGLSEKAKEMAENFAAANAAYKPAAEAYFDGINAFVEEGPTPIEFTIIGIPKRKFSIVDAYKASGYMSFGFAEGFKVDPIASKIAVKYGMQYLNDLGLHSINDSTYIPSYFGEDTVSLTGLAAAIDKIPVPLLIGSNSWIIDGTKTASGKPVFENDTHIGFSQPSVWFEAYLEYPGTTYYGHYLAGFPFGLLGHNQYATIGLTMFENDDVDLFVEKSNPEDSSQIWRKDHWENLSIRQESIAVKNQQDVLWTIRESDHGPIINDILLDDGVAEHPVAAWWAFLHTKRDLLEAVHMLNHSTSMKTSRQAASIIEAPGLNVMYADVDGNIAWWAAAKLPIRPEHVNSKLLLDGSSGKDDYLGFYTFNKNPQAENPPWGYVYSSNNQPAMVDSTLYPGYYMPMDRARAIVDKLEESDRWTAEDVKMMAGNVTSPVHPYVAKDFAKSLSSGQIDAPRELIDLLNNWDGNHDRQSIEPSVYYTLLSWVLYYAMADELGFKDYAVFVGSSLMKRSYFKFISNDNSVWWDNVNTEKKEGKLDILSASLYKMSSTLVKNMGSENFEDWQWGKIHTLTHNHPLGQIDALKNYFNVGPFPVSGGNEVINNLMFDLDTSGVFAVNAGPAVRTVIDLSDIYTAESINPTGQSGYFLSQHYDDQAQMFVDVKFRPQLMDKDDVEAHTQSVLTLLPIK